MKEDRKGKSLQEISRQQGVPCIDTHIFLCAGPDCCTEAEGEAAWQALKQRVKALYPRLSEARLYRTRVKCLRMCKDGPIAVAYPQGKWFGGVTAERVEGVVAHVLSGTEAPHPLEFARRPLPPPGAGDNAGDGGNGGAGGEGEAP